MNSVDLLVLVLILFNGIIGAVRGFTWQVFRLGSLVLGFWLSQRFAGDLSANGLLNWMGEEETARRVVAWAAIFGGTYVVMFMMGHWIRKLLDRLKLSSSDRSLGFLLGSLKGVVIVVVVLQVLVAFAPTLPDSIVHQVWGSTEEDIKPSQVGRLHSRFLAERMQSLFPPEVRERFARGLSEIRPG